MDTSSSFPFKTKFHHPYFTPYEVETLSTKQRGKLSLSQEERQRQQACSFIEAMGGRIGFPRRSIGTAQNIYHRFHLYFPRKDFSFWDVALAALYVSSKMHDTLKKPQDLLVVSYAIRFPDLAAKSRAHGGDIVMDPEKVEQDRQRLIAIERLILEMICFNFTSRLAFPYVIKMSRSLRATKQLANLAWRLSTDSHRTVAVLLFPPHTIALASIYLAGVLLSFESSTTETVSPEYKTSAEIAAFLGQPGPWQSQFQCRLEDIQEVAHMIMDLLLHEANSSSTHTSPSTPQSPSPYAHHPHTLTPLSTQIQPPPSIPHNPEQLTRLKIFMRENDAPRERKRNQSSGFVGGSSNLETKVFEEAGGLGTDQGTTRFLFVPPTHLMLP